jgi:hypothetical protein
MWPEAAAAALVRGGGVAAPRKIARRSCRSDHHAPCRNPSTRRWATTAGEHIYQCGDEEFQVAPGLVFLPRGIPHARRRVVPQAGRLIFMTFPGGFEGFFRILAEASQSGDLGEAAYARASRIASTFPDLGLSAGRVSGCRSMLAARVADDLPH